MGAKYKINFFMFKIEYEPKLYFRLMRKVGNREYLVIFDKNL